MEEHRQLVAPFELPNAERRERFDKQMIEDNAATNVRVDAARRMVEARREAMKEYLASRGLTYGVVKRSRRNA